MIYVKFYGGHKFRIAESIVGRALELALEGIPVDVDGDYNRDVPCVLATLTWRDDPAPAVPSAPLAG